MTVEVIWICYVGKLLFSKDAMKNMQRLRILSIQSYYARGIEDSEESDGSIDYLPNNLCWFALHGYPWKLLPQNFNPTSLVHIDLRRSSLHHLWNETKQLPSLWRLDLSSSKSLKSTPDFTGMPNLECLNLSKCTSLEEVHDSLRCSRKLIELNLSGCKILERFPCVNVESLEYLHLGYCSSLKKFPEFFGIMKSELEIKMQCSGIREIPSSFILPQWSHLTELVLSDMNNLVSLPEGIGDLEKLEMLDASDTLISRPPSSIIRLNKLKSLTFVKEISEDRENFVFPQVNEGLCSLEYWNLIFCNLIDGGLPEDIGSLSSLKELKLSGNNFEHLPQSIAQLGALRSLNLSNCKKLKELPEFPPQLDTICAYWYNDWICTPLFQNISSLQHELMRYSKRVSDSLSLRVFNSCQWDMNIPHWFHHRGTGRRVSVNLRENWYVSDNFLGFAVCSTGRSNNDMKAHLIPLCDDGASLMTQKLALSKPPSDDLDNIHFFLIPLAVVWDASKANGKMPNDYGRFQLYFPRFIRGVGVRLLYKDEVQIGMRRSRDEEGSCSSN